jgi:SAM-dependent methyltransferase
VSDERRQTWSDRYRTAAPVAAPSVFVERALALLDPPPTRRALDVACGRGRHALLLAARGYAVDAVDYALPALTAVQRVARERGLDVRCVAADVGRWPLPRERYDLVVVVSFLDRGLWPDLRAAVVPGGALLVETFVSDPSRDPPAMNPAFLLAPGELDNVCRGWDIVARHDGTAVHHGATIARAGVLARRPR